MMPATAFRPRRITPRGKHAPPLEQRQAAHRVRLYDAAVELIATERVDRFGVEAITREAGMSKQTFYELWPNLEAFLPALGQHIAASRADVRAKTPADAVRWAAARGGIIITLERAAQLAIGLIAEGWTRG